MVWTKNKIRLDSGEIVDAQSPIIVSASRSTDIPAFYADWFFNRLERGYSAWTNPFNGSKCYISYQNTRFIVFWSKNPKPLIPYLAKLRARNIGCYIQFTLNDYVSEGLEKSVPSVDERIHTFKELVGILGYGSVIWRFDPLVLTDTISVDDLIRKIEYIGDNLKGYTKKLVFSFVDIALYKKVEPHRQIALVAPTGRAAKRLSEACDLPASTIHRLLKWDINTNTFNHDKDHPIDVDLLIIDEFSMVDSYLFSRLLLACDHVSKILLIGDEAQLPSIAPGQVLYDLIETKQIECVFLKHIFRQHQHSGIISISHGLRNNELDVLSQMDKFSDIHFYPATDTRIQGFVSKIIQKAVNDGYDLYDFQVLSPMYQGAAGIDALNELLQEIVNPKADFKNEVKIYNHVFREGDKVLQLKNRPDDNVFNGDLGIIIEIQKRDGIYYHQDKVIVDFEGDIVEYTSQDFNQITLAYCMSIHKAQGSEFKIVVIPFSLSHRRMLKKNLIYTGMTRAKQALFLIGDKQAFIEGVYQTESHRETTLQERFKGNIDFSPYDFL